MARPRGERATTRPGSQFRDVQARLASNVRALRDQRGWTQEEAAHRSRMATRLLQRIEAADVNATLVTVARLCEGFEVDPVRLFQPAPRPTIRPAGRPRR